MRTRPSLAFSQLNFEVLEERCLLAAAVGSFTRIGGNVGAPGGAYARVPDLYPVIVSHALYPGNFNNTVYDDSGQQIAMAANEDGSAFAEHHASALVPTPIGSGTPYPNSP